MVTPTRKVRTPEGAARYGQPIGTIITKDLAAKAALRFAFTPYTVQYGLGVLTFEQLQKVAKKYQKPTMSFPDGFTAYTPEATAQAGLDSLWGFLTSSEGKVYRWDRMPNGLLLIRTVEKADVPKSVSTMLPKGAWYDTPGITPYGYKVSPDSLYPTAKAWLDTKKLPPVVSDTTVEQVSQSGLDMVSVAEGDYASKIPDTSNTSNTSTADVVASTEPVEPVLRWQKITSKSLTAAFQSTVGDLTPPVYRLFLDGQSVGLAGKTKNGWVLYHKGSPVATASTKAGLGAAATDMWMEKALTPDGKATIPVSSTQEIEELQSDVSDISDTADAQQESIVPDVSDIPGLAGQTTQPTEVTAESVVVKNFEGKPYMVPKDSVLIVADNGDSPIGYMNPDTLQAHYLNGSSLDLPVVNKKYSLMYADPQEYMDSDTPQDVLYETPTDLLIAQQALMVEVKSYGGTLFSVPATSLLVVVPFGNNIYAPVGSVAAGTDSLVTFNGDVISLKSYTKSQPAYYVAPQVWKDTPDFSMLQDSPEKAIASALGVTIPDIKTLTGPDGALTWMAAWLDTHPGQSIAKGLASGVTDKYLTDDDAKTLSDLFSIYDVSFTAPTDGFEGLKAALGDYAKDWDYDWTNALTGGPEKAQKAPRSDVQPTQDTTPTETDQEPTEASTLFNGKKVIDGKVAVETVSPDGTVSVSHAQVLNSEWAFNTWSESGQYFVQNLHGEDADYDQTYTVTYEDGLVLPVKAKSTWAGPKMAVKALAKAARPEYPIGTVELEKTPETTDTVSESPQTLAAKNGHSVVNGNFVIGTQFVPANAVMAIAPDSNELIGYYAFDENGSSWVALTDSDALTTFVTAQDYFTHPTWKPETHTSPMAAVWSTMSKEAQDLALVAHKTGTDPAEAVDEYPDDVVFAQEDVDAATHFVAAFTIKPVWVSDSYVDSLPGSHWMITKLDADQAQASPPDIATDPGYAIPGGIHVTKADVVSAIQILTDAKGIMVKGPLAKAGNPLAKMDYHALAAKYLDAHQGKSDKTKLAVLDALTKISTSDPDSTGFTGTEVSKQWIAQTKKVPGVVNVHVVKGKSPLVSAAFTAEDAHPGSLPWQQSVAKFAIPANAVLVYADTGDTWSIPAWKRGLVGWYSPDTEQYSLIKPSMVHTADSLPDPTPLASTYTYVDMASVVSAEGKNVPDLALTDLTDALGYSNDHSEVHPVPDTDVSAEPVAAEPVAAEPVAATGSVPGVTQVDPTGHVVLDLSLAGVPAASEVVIPPNALLVFSDDDGWSGISGGWAKKLVGYQVLDPAGHIWQYRTFGPSGWGSEQVISGDLSLDWGWAPPFTTVPVSALSDGGPDFDPSQFTVSPLPGEKTLTYAMEKAPGHGTMVPKLAKVHAQDVKAPDSPSKASKAQGTQVGADGKMAPQKVVLGSGIAALPSPKPIAAGRYAKKGSKGYLDVHSDGTGTYTAPSGKASPQSKTQVRARLAKGLVLTVPAKPPVHGALVGHMYALVKPDGKGSLVTDTVPYNRFLPGEDGYVRVQNWNQSGGWTAITDEEFQAMLSDIAASGLVLRRQGMPFLPVFADTDSALAWVDAHGFFPGMGYYADLNIPSDAGFFEALSGSFGDFHTWVKTWNSTHGYQEKIQGADVFGGIATKGDNYRPMYEAARAAYGIPAQKINPYQPLRDSAYTQVGPFWVREATGGVFAPRGTVYQITSSTSTYWMSSMKTGELTQVMEDVVADMGLTGILFPKKGMYTKYEKISWLRALRVGDMATIVAMEKNKGNDSSLLDQLPGKVPWESPVPSEFPAGTVGGDWSATSVWKSLSVNAADQEIDNYLIAARCAHPEFMTFEERRNWAVAHRAGAMSCYQISEKARDRSHAGGAPITPAPVYTPGVTPKHLWEKYADTILTAGVVNESWSVVEAVYEDYYTDQVAGTTVSEQVAKTPFKSAFWEALYKSATGTTAVPDQATFPNLPESTYFKTLFQHATQAQANVDAAISKIPVLSKPTSSTGLKVEKGTHPVSVVTDQFGNPWVFKQLPEDFRVDVEVMAVNLADLFGFNPPEAIGITGGEIAKHHLGSKAGFAQRFVPNSGTIKGTKVATLTTTQQTDIALDHVFDWFLDNDDGHKDNFLVTETGHLEAIDKGRAFKHFGVWKGLSGDYQADSNSSLASTELFAAIKSHQISEKDAQAIYLAAVQRARKIQETPWEKIEPLIAAGMAKRTYWYPSSTPQNIDQLLAKVKTRHDQMSEDIDTMWKKVLAEAGYSAPLMPIKPLNDRYEQVDEQFAVNLTQTRALGQSLMVSGPSWEGGHLLFWTDSVKGQERPHGQGKLLQHRKKALYEDLYASVSTESPKNPAEVKAQDVQTSVHALRDLTHNTWRKMAQNHSKTVVGDANTPVTVEQVTELFETSTAAWEGQRDDLMNIPGINDAYVDAIDAQMTAWMVSMRDELTAAITENRKSVRLRFNKPNLPIANPPKTKAAWEKAWKTTLDHHESATVYTDTDPAYLMPVPPKMVMFTPETVDASVSAFETRFPELVKMGVTISTRTFQGPKAELHHRSLESEVSGETTSGYGGGSEYVLTLPTGEQVLIAAPGQEIRSWGDGNGPVVGDAPGGKTLAWASWGGLVRFQGAPGQDVQQMWERVRPVLDVLEPVTDVTDTDLQLLYYRQLIGSYQTHAKVPENRVAILEAVRDTAVNMGVSQNRFGLTPASYGKYGVQQVLTFDTDILAQAGMSKDEELAFWQNQFTALMGADVLKAFNDNQGWRPRFEHEVKSGLPTMHPYWQRVDVDYQQLMASGYYLKHGGMDTRHLVWTPLVATAGRVRAIHQYWDSGQSSDSDMHNGSGSVVYTSPGKGKPSGGYIFFSPLVAARIGVYSAPFDDWGRPWNRSDNAPLMPMDILKDATEVCIPHNLGWDSVLHCHGSGYTRDTALQMLADAGVSTLGGRPPAEVIGAEGGANSLKVEQERVLKILSSGGWV